MKFSASAAITAAVAVLLPAVSNGLTEEQWARIAQDTPSKTESYVKNMKLVASGQKKPVISRSGWTAVASSSQSSHPASYAIDGNTSTYWESEETPVLSPFPHTITVDMKQEYYVTGVTYLPRQDEQNGTVGAHSIELSTDGVNWSTTKAFGTWYDDSELKTANFSTTQARYIRLVATSEAGNVGTYSNAADINVFTVPSYTAPNPYTQGSFQTSIDFPTIMVAAAVNQGTGEVIAWSSYEFDDFEPNEGIGQTYTTLYNPATESVSELVVSNTDHDMFCPGLSRDSQGRPIVTGGNNAYRTSMYTPGTNSWSQLPDMVVPRGYQGQTTLSDGRIFTIGGSFNGGDTLLKNGEFYDAATNVWTNLTGCLVEPMLTNDAAGYYRSDNHGWFLAWRNSTVFQAGPSSNMNWYGTLGEGNTTSAGTRGNDPDAMNGNAVMYDATKGLILAVGGSPNYDSSYATSNAHIIQIGAPYTTPNVTQINNMNYPRAFANSVIMPNGNVFIVGGQTFAVTFTDTNAVMTPEIWNPTTETFTPVAPIASPRTYHSTALLLPDASIIVGGGGLCGSCTVNHFDAQIYYPPYFYNADGSLAARPAIESVSATTFAVGAKLTVTVNEPITRLTMMRYGSATHALDTDQRRVPLTTLSKSGNTYVVQIPNDTGIMIPGAWMLFAMKNSVPSVATTVMVTN